MRTVGFYHLAETQLQHNSNYVVFASSFGGARVKGRAATERFIISFLYDLSGRIKKYSWEIPRAARSNDLNAYGAKIFVFTQIQI